MTILFTCRGCGFQAPSLEDHRCGAAAPERAADDLRRLEELEASARLKKAKAVLSEVEGREKVKPVEAVPAAAPKGGFDRVGYQRAYMRGWRARRKGAA